MLKATGGGGGMGLQVCQNEEELYPAFQKVKSRGNTLFNNSGVFLEKYYPESRHIEVQIFGNGTDVAHFGERECSIQRRHQKVRCWPNTSAMTILILEQGYRRMSKSFRRTTSRHAKKTYQLRSRLRITTPLQICRHNRISRR